MKRLSLLMLLFLVGCGPSTYGDYGYNDFESLLDWADLKTLDDEDSITMMYYYNRDFFGTDCAGCQLVNERLFEYGKTNDEGIELILVNERTVMGIRPITLNRQPTVFFLDGETITYTVYAAADILELLDALENNTFDMQQIEGEFYE